MEEERKIPKTIEEWDFDPSHYSIYYFPPPADDRMTSEDVVDSGWSVYFYGPSVVISSKLKNLRFDLANLDESTMRIPLTDGLIFNFDCFIIQPALVPIGLKGIITSLIAIEILENLVHGVLHFKHVNDSWKVTFVLSEDWQHELLLKRDLKKRLY